MLRRLPGIGRADDHLHVGEVGDRVERRAAAPPRRPTRRRAAVASSTRKRLAIDQRMSAAIMACLRSRLCLRREVGRARSRRSRSSRPVRLRADLELDARRPASGSASGFGRRRRTPSSSTATSATGSGRARCSTVARAARRSRPCRAPRCSACSAWVAATVSPAPGSRASVAAQARLGVDQELAGDDDLVAGLEPLADLGRRPPDSIPTSTSTARNRPSPSATITTLRSPVRITASAGTSRRLARRARRKRGSRTCRA